jgi:Ca-activated chloride channel family protein
MPAEFHFLRPEWLWGIPAVLLLALALARRRLAPGSWQRIVDPALAPYVLARNQVRGLNYRWWLMLLSGLIAMVAIAGPAWNRVDQPVFRSEQAIVIALDLSYSMDAQDLTPSRLARAKLKILDILARRKSGQTALIVYSANAFTVTPLTTDSDTVAALVNSLSTDIMPSRGSYPPAAIEKGLQLLKQAGVGYGEVLLITDGGSSAAAERAARELRDAGYTLSVMGVGTTQGAPIPKSGGGFITDRSGNIAVPKLELRQLQSLAAAGGGRYTTLGTDDRDIDTLLSGEVADASSSDESVATDQWQEEGPWLLLILVPLAAMAFRRGLVITLLLFVLPLPQNAQAFGWQDLWRNRDQQGQKQLQEGNAADAAALFEDPAWRAVASYQAGDFGGSAAGFAAGEDQDSLYNRGNALARLGEFQSAIDAYEQALKMNPDMQDAAYNRDLVKELLQQQQDSKGDQQGGQQSENEGGGAQQSESDSESQQQSKESSAGEAGSESKDGESSVRDEDMSQEDLEAMQKELERAAQQAEQNEGEAESKQSMSQAEAEQMRRMQEQQQAMEQWLRRIPNDPGGLLRRKFQYQYQRMGRDQDGNNLWPDDEVQPW